MIEKLTYKNFIGTVHYSSKDEVFFGKILGISDLVTFEGTSVKQLNISFQEAVEDYIILCQEVGIVPLKLKSTTHHRPNE